MQINFTSGQAFFQIVRERHDQEAHNLIFLAALVGKKEIPRRVSAREYSWAIKFVEHSYRLQVEPSV